MRVPAEIIQAIRRLGQRVNNVERSLSRSEAGTPSRRRNLRQTYIRLDDHLLPGGSTTGQLVTYNTGHQCWVPIGTGLVTVRDPLSITLAPKCDIVVATQQFGNEFHCVGEKTAGKLAVAMSDGDCGDVLTFCIGSVCDTCACDSGSSCDVIDSSGSSLTSSSGSGPCPVCDPGPMTFQAEYLGDGTITDGDLAMVWVDRRNWFDALTGSASKIVARRLCGNTCDSGSSGSSDEPCVFFETDVRCEGDAICIYKRAKEPLFDGGRFVGCNVSEWMLQGCCDICCGSSGSSSGSSATGICLDGEPCDMNCASLSPSDTSGSEDLEDNHPGLVGTLDWTWTLSPVPVCDGESVTATLSVTNNTNEALFITHTPGTDLGAGSAFTLTNNTGATGGTIGIGATLQWTGTWTYSKAAATPDVDCCIIGIGIRVTFDTDYDLEISTGACGIVCDSVTA